MKVLVTGSAGHLGEGLVRALRDLGHEVVSLDILESPFTTDVGSIADRTHVKRCMNDVQTVYHAATLHKPHMVTHSRQDFIDTNITGTLNLLEEAVAEGAHSFIYTSTTSVFGDALVPPPGAPAAWVTEDVEPIPKNIYGATKRAAEDLCRLFHRNQGLACIILRTSRFFPEEDDNKTVRARYSNENTKANEFLYRRVDLDDAVEAHLLAAKRAPEIGFGCYIVSATTPFRPEDLQELRTDAPAVVRRYVSEYEEEYRRRGWSMLPGIERVYANERARNDLGWKPKFDFGTVIESLQANEEPRGPLAIAVGSKGYHAETFIEGPYPVE